MKSLLTKHEYVIFDCSAYDFRTACHSIGHFVTTIPDHSTKQTPAHARTPNNSVLVRSKSKETRTLSHRSDCVQLADMEDKLKQAQAQAAANQVACKEAEANTRAQTIIAENWQNQYTELQGKLANAHAQFMASEENRVKTVTALEQQIERLRHDTVMIPTPQTDQYESCA